MSSSLRIALVVNPFTLRSRAGEHPPALARELLGLGHTVRGFGAAPGSIPRSSNDPQVDGGVAPGEGVGLLGFQPDVIVAYDGLSPAAWLGARRARRLDVPLVLVEEGFPEVGRPLERFLRRAGERLWGSYVRHSADRVVALDPVARGQALREGFAAERVSILPGGVDLAAYRPGLTSRLPSEHGIRGRLFLHIGWIEDGRGLDVLLHAFARTVGRRDDWSLAFAGEGGARARLRALAERLGVGSQVHWLPRPRPEELPGLLGASTLLAAPYLSDDLSSLKVRRALACGLPVLASEVPRLEDLVEADGCGLLASAGDLTAWTDLLRTAASDPERRRRWSRRAREIAEERFAWPAIAGAFEAQLLEAVELRRVAAEAGRGEEEAAPSSAE